jgi:hypothetical protein
MIPRRLIRHLKDQHWFAVWVDLFIVVLGVFIGIQVSNWNEARRDRQSEREYLERLRHEVREILPQAQSTNASLAEQLKLIEELRAFLASGLGSDALGERHCIAAGRSHIYAASIFYPPTIKELISTGRILLIRNPAIRTAIMSFDQANADMSQLRTDIQIDRRVLARYYPELIDSGLSADWSGAKCDFEGMRENQAFLNDFTDNVRRYSAYASELGERQAEALALLARTLAVELPASTVQASEPGAQANPADKPGGD